MSTPEKLMRLQEVKPTVGLQKSSIYALMRAGDFPKPVRLSARAVAWKYSDIAAWMQSRQTT
jgi:prophage regulatory protein